MISLLVVCVFLPVVLGAGQQAWIVNGNNVNIEDFPWQGSYRTSGGSHTCGCVFIGGSYVLTAGHCGGSTSYSIEFGASNRRSGKVFGVRKITRHPDYNRGSGFTPNDIAVIQASSIISGDNISPGVMAKNSNNPGRSGWITGWGRTCGTCGIPVTLQGVEIPIIADSECSAKWGQSFQKSMMICVYSGSTGSCNGDSGGPLSVGNTIYGVTSWGVNGCSPSYPSVYTRVGAYHSWACAQTSNTAVGC